MYVCLFMYMCERERYGNRDIYIYIYTNTKVCISRILVYTHTNTFGCLHIKYMQHFAQKNMHNVTYIPLYPHVSNLSVMFLLNSINIMTISEETSSKKF